MTVMPAIATMTTPLGPLWISAIDAGVTGVSFDPLPEAARQNGNQNASGQRHARAAREQLAEYFSGRRTHFDLPLAAQGTAFQQQVWHALTTVTYGTTASYRDIAIQIGNPQAVRAVGAANGRNPIAIVVPCHRVIGANGTLTGYAGGLDRKRWLLAHEQQEKDLFTPRQ